MFLKINSDRFDVNEIIAYYPESNKGRNRKKDHQVILIFRSNSEGTVIPCRSRKERSQILAILDAAKGVKTVSLKAPIINKKYKK